ncbi:hypothetical protein [Streptomyces sp. NPDC057375]
MTESRGQPVCSQIHRPSCSRAHSGIATTDTVPSAARTGTGTRGPRLVDV